MRLRIAGLFVLLGLCLGAAPSFAHEAPSGWSYSTECCSGFDCAPATAEVRATPQGWLLTDTGEIVSYGSPKLRQSGDGEFHVCRPPGLQVDGSPLPLRCLYVPPQGY